ncbi:hypothetical protein RHGRI_014066 [Rhododendron griersonianum]|uniref:Protein FAR1-RELATED SEQUENCE n=1 Tax=Rhododendron griersonianum TaxID=479676 RepID=A0AAV6K8A9_9ERIC|nr:hypothetical protein RHGRI_014066 [Rhododendron griersonianum]
MEFDTSNEAYLYYSRYDKENGFAVAKRTSQKGRDAGKARVRTSNPIKPRPQTKIVCHACFHISLFMDGKWRLNRVFLECNHEQSSEKCRFYRSNRVLDEHVKRKLY